MRVNYLLQVYPEINGANVDQVVNNLIGYLDHDTDGAAAYLVDDIAEKLSRVGGDLNELDMDELINYAAENAASDLIYWKDYGDALAAHWYEVQEAINEGIYDIAEAIQCGTARDYEEDLKEGLADIIAAALISYRVKECCEILNRDDVKNIKETAENY